MKPPMPSTLPRFWADLKSPDFARLDLTRSIAVLPVAAIEQHGPHLPLSVDTDLVNGVIAAAFVFTYAVSRFKSGACPFCRNAHAKS